MIHLFDSFHLQEYEVKQFYLTLDYIERLCNLFGLNFIKEKFCYKKVLFHYFCQPTLLFHNNFSFQLQLEKELLVDQDLLFQSKQILDWWKQRIWLANFSNALFVEQKSSIFSTYGWRFFCRWIQGAHLHFISHAHALDVIRQQFVERALAFAEWKSSLKAIYEFASKLNWFKSHQF